ncbi:MAG: T9SS type A sorting domain-containing protein [Calditrichae bacterium]|nr:T9SS type A sorting domain-containing protein [Calditrichia bacterium]
MKILLQSLTIFILVSIVNAQESPIVFTERPQTMQFYSRDNNDSAIVEISGNVVQAGYDQIKITVFKNNFESKVYNQDLVYDGDTSPFKLLPKIHAEQAEYKFTVDLISAGISNNVFTADSVICGDAYIISGQSNSHYAWEDADYQNEYCRTFGVKTGSSNYFDYDPADTLWSLSQGSSMVGPGVGTLGIYIQKYILEETGIPTVVFNGGTGGSIISEHQPDQADRMDLTTIYGKLLYRISKSKVNKIRAIIWHQGENDSDPDKVNTYPGYFDALYQAWMADYNPEKIYLFQIHPGCGGIDQSRFREMQRTLAATLEIDNLELMSTAGIPGHDGCHYSHEGYRVMAEWVYRLIRTDYYGSNDTNEIYPPDIKDAIYDRYNEQIILIFDNTADLIWPSDTLGVSMKDYFYFDDDYGVVKSGRANNDTLFLRLNGPNFFDKITYLPDIRYNENSNTYEGPWIKNIRGVGALSFDNISIQKTDTTIKVISPNGDEIWNPSTIQTIEWTADKVETVNIYFSADNGLNWVQIAENAEASKGSYDWTTATVTSSECKIKVVASTDPTIADESNHVFGIFSKQLQLTSPNGGEMWASGSNETITWESEFIFNLRIEYSTDGGANWKTVKRLTPAASGQVDWVVPEEVSEQCLIKLIDTDETNITDQSDAFFSIVPVSAISGDNDLLPAQYSLEQNQPNPFNPHTNISFRLPEASHVKLGIYDITGKEITVLIDSGMSAGNHQVVFKADTYNLGSGVYLVKMEAGSYKEVRKMILAK